MADIVQCTKDILRALRETDPENDPLSKRYTDVRFLTKFTKKERRLYNVINVLKGIEIIHQDKSSLEWNLFWMRRYSSKMYRYISSHPGVFHRVSLEKSITLGASILEKNSKRWNKQSQVLKVFEALGIVKELADDRYTTHVKYDVEAGYWKAYLDAIWSKSNRTSMASSQISNHTVSAMLTTGNLIEIRYTISLGITHPPKGEIRREKKAESLGVVPLNGGGGNGAKRMTLRPLRPHKGTDTFLLCDPFQNAEPPSLTSSNDIDSAKGYGILAPPRERTLPPSIIHRSAEKQMINLSGDNRSSENACGMETSSFRDTSNVNFGFTQSDSVSSCTVSPDDMLSPDIDDVLLDLFPDCYLRNDCDQVQCDLDFM